MTTRFLLKLRCTDCGRKYQRTVDNADCADPPCPNCAKVPQAIGLDVGAGKAPGIGGGAAVRAMDFTMEAVAADYGLTDLNTDAREGMSMAPKLPPQQQAMADAMFNPTVRQQQIGQHNPTVAARLSQVAATAMAGGYRQNDPVNAPDPVLAAQAGRQKGERIKVNFVGGDNG